MSAGRVDHFSGVLGVVMVECHPERENGLIQSLVYLRRSKSWLIEIQSQNSVGCNLRNLHFQFRNSGFLCRILLFEFHGFIHIAWLDSWKQRRSQIWTRHESRVNECLFLPDLILILRGIACLICLRIRTVGLVLRSVEGLSLRYVLLCCTSFGLISLNLLV